jgi:hypothetical protein
MDRRAFLKTTGAGALLTGTGLAWAQTSLKPLPIELCREELLQLVENSDKNASPFPMTICESGQFKVTQSMSNWAWNHNARLTSYTMAQPVQIWMQYSQTD